MGDSLLSGIDSDAVLHASIELPYTLTTGRAAGAFLSALEEQRLLGSACEACARTVVPAQDFCSRCGEEMNTFLNLPHNGTVTAITRTADGVMGIIAIDGADTGMVHRLIGDELALGSRVHAVWDTEVKQNLLALSGFIAGESAHNEITPAVVEDSSQTVSYGMKLDYEHSYGPYYGRLFDELSSTRRIIGSKCSECRNVLVPPRAICELCYRPTTQFVDVADEGRIQAFSVINLEFVGQTRKPPYVYAEIVLDGSSTRLIHNVGGIDMATAKERLSIGMRVKAVWKPAEECIGTLNDIDYFEPID